MKHSVLVAAGVLFASILVVPSPPVAAAGAVAVISNSQWGPDIIGYLHVVGELQNTGTTNVRSVQVNLAMYSNTGTLLGTDSTYSEVSILAPGDKSPFELWFEPPAAYSSYQLSTGFSETTDPPNHNFTVVVTNQYTDSSGYRHVVGQVTNNNLASDFVQVIVTFYDNSGRVVAMEWDFVDTGSTSTLQPGQTASFEVVVSPSAPTWASLAAMADSSTPPRLPRPPGSSGYWMLASKGQVYAFGDAAHFGNGTVISFDKVDIEPTLTGNGYWILNTVGLVEEYGDADWFGGLGFDVPLQPDEQTVSMSATPSGRGYWLFTSKGRVFAFGDAAHFGDMSGTRLNGPVLDSVATPSGRGYWMVASDGGIFTFGDAKFYGSMGGVRLNKPVMSMAPDPDGAGYWLVASDGGIFSFEATFYGSMGGVPLNKPVSGMVTGPAGYLMVAEDGGIFAFGNVPFKGSLGNNPPPYPVIAVALLP